MAWEGDKVRARLIEAQKFAVDEIMSACVIFAKNSHPGWLNRTGTAEGSIRIVSEAQEAGAQGGGFWSGPVAAGVSGMWGSADVDYMIWLELNHGSALRSAADQLYPGLAGRIAAELA